MNPQSDMVYVRRDTQGQILEVSMHPGAGLEPCLAVGETEFSGLSKRLSGQINSLASSDLAMARVLEDLIDLLIARNVIRFTDLPPVAREKLLNRRNLRAEVKGLDLLGDELEEVL